MSVLSIFKNLSFVEKFTSGGLLDSVDSTRSSSSSNFGEKTQDHIKNLLSSKYSAEILEGIRLLHEVIHLYSNGFNKLFRLMEEATQYQSFCQTFYLFFPILILM